MKKLVLLFSVLIAQIVLGQNGRVGVNTTTPTQTFHVIPLVGDEPLRIQGLRSAQVGDTSLLITDQTTGIVRYMGLTQLSSLISLSPDQVWQIILSKPDTLFSNPTFINSFTNAIYNYGDTLLQNTNFVNSLYQNSRDSPLDIFPNRM